MAPGAALFVCCLFFFFNDTATTEIYTLSLHDALPIYVIDTNGLWISGAKLPVDPVEVGNHRPRGGVLILCRYDLWISSARFTDDPFEVDNWGSVLVLCH